MEVCCCSCPRRSRPAGTPWAYGHCHRLTALTEIATPADGVPPRSLFQRRSLRRTADRGTPVVVVPAAEPPPHRSPLPKGRPISRLLGGRGDVPNRDSRGRLPGGRPTGTPVNVVPPAEPPTVLANRATGRERRGGAAPGGRRPDCFPSSG